MIDRRLFIAGLACAALPARAALPVPPARVLAFDVMRKGKKIGAHGLRFETSGDELRVIIDVALDVSFGPIKLFTYRHNAVEIWRGDEWVSVQATTTQNGEKMLVTGRRTATGVAVDGPKGKFAAPANTLAATHWNRRMLDGPFLNTQTGEVQRPKIERRGEVMIAARGERVIRAEHFAMAGEVVLDTYYDAAPSWAGLRFKGGDGSTITYERV
ncbi:DUF6134 family protein [Sphingoaurantiacus capsulatus]|uniref:DUF6134 family protein n=1 Tax=Sphingoaurantiacus capsulatus TaxID=1771310 RepID=A0ABV7X8V4_9SPHN